ncbi:MAG: DUF58 domain-containing protein [Verrucomicrobia bacterium]|nr:MAG: DUF58 domain-containing protein [Verrucomicrobiota bacterium]
MAGILTPELLRRLEQFQLLAARRAKSSARGERRSRARGQSVEFADHRNYVVGDDLRYLDWNLFGRLDRLFLKLYEEERELPVRIFLDGSESMTFGTPPKFDFARQVAAAIGYVALCGFDRVAVHAFPEPRASDFADAAGLNVQMAVRGALRAVRGRKSAMEYFRNLTALSAGGPADLNAALKRGAMEARQTGLAVVLSDFLDPGGYEAGLHALVARGFEVNVIQILAPEELNPTAFGDLRLVDSETGALQEVTFGKYRLAAYRQSVANYVQRLREFCQSRGMGVFSVGSGTSLEELLLKQLRASEIWA